MKRIINGKKYDTETALHRAEYSHGFCGEKDGYEEHLYEKMNGEFFLMGSGYGNTKYRAFIKNGCNIGTGIFPLTNEEARAWVERYANEEYEVIYGEVEE